MYPDDVITLDSKLEGEHIDTVIEWLIREFKESNSLEFVNIRNRVELSKQLLDKSITYCLNNDEQMP